MRYRSTIFDDSVPSRARACAWVRGEPASCKGALSVQPAPGWVAAIGSAAVAMTGVFDGTCLKSGRRVLCGVLRTLSR